MNWKKRFLVRVARTSGFATFVNLLERVDSPRHDLLRVLTYHRVADPGSVPDPALVSATPEAFGRQMQMLAARYRVVALNDVQHAFLNGGTLPPRAVLLTFDDAYRDFAELAWPVLQRLNLPVTLFVPTAYPDQPQRVFWWDRLCHALSHTPRSEPLETPCGTLPLRSPSDRQRAAKILRTAIKDQPHHQAMRWIDQLCSQLAPDTEARNEVLGWSELKSLAEQGVTLAPHTRTHPLLDRLPLEEARREAADSLQDLRQQVADPPPVLAYPAGGHAPDVVEALRSDGFQLAFTTRPGVNRIGQTDPLQLRRLHIGVATSAEVLRARLCLARR